MAKMIINFYFDKDHTSGADLVAVVVSTHCDKYMTRQCCKAAVDIRVGHADELSIRNERECVRRSQTTHNPFD